MKTKKMPKPAELHNLEEFNSQGGVTRKVKTIAYNVPYGMCQGLLNKSKANRHLPGTFWKIVPNVTLPIPKQQAA